MFVRLLFLEFTNSFFCPFLFPCAKSISASTFPAVVKQLCNLRLLGKNHYTEIASGVKHCPRISWELLDPGLLWSFLLLTPATFCPEPHTLPLGKPSSCSGLALPPAVSVYQHSQIALQVLHVLLNSPPLQSFSAKVFHKGSTHSAPKSSNIFIG